MDVWQYLVLAVVPGAFAYGTRKTNVWWFGAIFAFVAAVAVSPLGRPVESTCGHDEPAMMCFDQLKTIAEVALAVAFCVYGVVLVRMGRTWRAKQQRRLPPPARLL